jgi:hypothetical protein
LTSQDINSVAGVAGKPIYMVEPEEVREELIAAFPDLSAVSVEVALPAKVMVSVDERQPVIVWVQDDTETWVDGFGIGFPVRGESEGLIQVNARSSPPGLKTEAKEEKTSEESEGEEITAVETAREEVAPEEVEPEIFMTVALVHAIQLMAEEAPEGKPLVYSRDHGLGWEDKRGWEVYFGTDDEDMDMKLRVYNEIVRRLKKDDVRPGFISVEYVHAPYYRLDQ